MTVARTPTRTSPGRSPGRPSRKTGPSTRLPLVIGLTAIAVALVWFGFLFVQFREGTLVGGEFVYTFDDAWAFDLDAYVHAAQRLTVEGSLYAKELVAAPFEPGEPDLFYYAPPLGVAMLPLVDVPVHDSSVLWYVLRIGSLLAACLLMPVKPLIRALAFLAVAFTVWAMKDAILGNVSILLVFPLVVAWRWLDRPLGSVALAASMSVRPGLGLFLLWQGLRRRWRALAWTIGAGLALIALTLPFVGIDGYREYATVVSHLSVPAGLSENRDLGATVQSLGASAEVVGAVRLLSIAIGIGIVLLGLRRDREIGFMLTLCGSLLIVPLLWELYLLTLIVPVALLAERTRPVVLLLMLASWLPALLTPFMLLAVVALLFTAPPVQPGSADRPVPAAVTP